MAKQKILVSALEHSANVHLGSVLKHLDSYELVGVFSKEFGKPLVDMQDRSIMGFSDAIKSLPFFLKLGKQMVELSGKADKVLLIDSSGFNLPLAKRIKKRYPKKEIIYYILPQAWAWKRKRVFTLADNVENLLSILPFEKDIYPPNANIEYVGHPLLDQITEFKTSTPNKVKNILFMPGSRRAEIAKLMPIFRKVANRLKLNATIAVPKHFKDSLNIYGNLDGFNIEYNSQKALKEADFAFICSGTATLEAAIIGTPFVLSYIAKPLDYFIGTKLIKLNYIGLANIFFEKMGKDAMHKELLQDDVTAKNLINEFNNFDYIGFLDNSKELRDYLEQGSSKRVANIIV